MLYMWNHSTSNAWLLQFHAQGQGAPARILSMGMLSKASLALAEGLMIVRSRDTYGGNLWFTMGMGDKN